MRVVLPLLLTSGRRTGVLQAMTRRLLFALAAVPLLGQSPERKLDLDSFEKVWSTIRDKHWEKNPAGLDWQKIHDEYRPRVEQARTREEARAAMQDMLARLKQTHFGILPATVYSSIDEEAGGPGSAGIDLRVLDHEAIVVSVDPGSPAERAGVKPGWKLASARGRSMDELIQRLKDVPELTLTRAILAPLSGEPGGSVPVVMVDGAGARVKLDLGLAAPRGEATAFGNLPDNYVWVETKRHLGDAAYIRFNMFLDLVRVVTAFSNLVKNCTCDGLIVDLRGNPGGIGGMAMGLAGFLIDKPGERLGTMYMRDATLNFVINPRPPVFTGPVAILVDGTSASTSEIFAGGLQDLGRARVFGTRTAAAALPSVIERLPNGDGFQYAVANYISEGGKPLEGLGVKPDVEVKLTRAALLTGHDAVEDAAGDWIRDQTGGRKK
jgi:carboxyl-terminal processing protease